MGWGICFDLGQRFDCSGYRDNNQNSIGTGKRGGGICCCQMRRRDSLMIKSR
jgi:hypothetical protein